MPEANTGDKKPMKVGSGPAMEKRYAVIDSPGKENQNIEVFKNGPCQVLVKGYIINKYRNCDICRP